MAASRSAMRFLLVAVALLGRSAGTPPRGLQAAPLQGSCRAYTKEACLVKPGCHWFQHHADGGCPLCKRWFGSQVGVTGCRDWSADLYCREYIVGAAQHQHGADLSDSAVRRAVGHYEIVQGTPEHDNPFRKHMVCSVFCDVSPPFRCQGQPRAKHEVKGVNYGGRFIPELYLSTYGIGELFQGISHPDVVLGKPVRDLSLCDLGAAKDAGMRLAKYLDQSIRPEHFTHMADLGFNVVRLPLGYWNLIEVPSGAAPNSDTFSSRRYLALQGIMPAARYRPWIEKVFHFAAQSGMQVLLDLHGAPGGQQDNGFTGCDQGQGNIYFDTPWNKLLAIRAIAQMAEICNRHGETCYGIELLNEPAGAVGPGGSGGGIDRDVLSSFYKSAILEARQHMAWEKPIIIMDWPGWLGWWMAQPPLLFREFGHIKFATHLYYLGPFIVDQARARATYAQDLEKLRSFYANTRYDLVITEYALNNHGTGGPSDDAFDYNSLANWFVHQFNQHGIGSMVWNFDAGPCAWGPVAADRVGRRPVQWKAIFNDMVQSPQELEV